VEGDAGHLGYHLPRLACGIIGKYERVCGGCDGIKEADEVVRRIKLFSTIYRYVILEGILVSHTYGRYAALATQLREGGVPYVFCFIDTPRDVCVQRVLNRRAEAGNTKPFNPANLDRDHATVWGKLRHKARQDGHAVVELDHRDPLRGLLPLLQQDI
jgi:hypothetical protein